jgi:hypothetical protein
MSGTGTGSRLHTVATGVLFVLSGACLWAALRGWFTFEQSRAWWPLGFLFPAVHRFTSDGTDRSLLAGLGWLMTGAVLILVNLGYLELSSTTALAVASLAAGARLLYLALTRDREVA